MNAVHDIFISHSHADTRAAKALAVRWEGFGHRVYADFRDEQLIEASRTNTMDAALAEHLRRTIRRCRIFVFVASANSATSGWMPWELGMAHGAVGRVHLYRLGGGAAKAFKRREYLKLYEATSFDARNASEYLTQAVAQAKREAASPAQREAAMDQGARAAQAFKQLRIGDATRELSESPAVQGGLTVEGLAREAGTSMPFGTSYPFSRR